MIKRFLFLAFVAGYTLPAFGQTESSSSTNGQKQASGNNGSGIGSIFSPNLYDGTASVNIPIYDYTVGGTNLGVSISYDTHGIKVDQLASNVGLGWSMFSGGSLTRQVHGIEDEAVLYYPVRNCSTCNIAYQGVWFPKRSTNPVVEADDQEGEHDVFTASIGGRSVSFEVDVPGNALVRKDNLKLISIIPFLANSDKPFYIGGKAPIGGTDARKINKDNTTNILGFWVTDEIGNVFTFERGDYEIKVVDSICTYYATTKWNLTSVKTADGQTVKYTYGSVPVDYPSYKSERVQEVQYPIVGAFTTIPTGINVLENKIVRYKGVMTYLQKIEYPNGTTLDFDYRMDQCADAPLLPLDKITVSSKYSLTHVTTKAYKFSYSFFQSPWKTYTAAEIPYKTCLEQYNYYGSESDSDKKAQQLLGLRLKLNKIDLVGTDGVTTEPYYSFIYEPTRLPRRLDPGKDFYGYFNGKSPQNTGGTTGDLVKNMAIPLHVSPILVQVSTAPNTYLPLIYGTDKTPDLTYMKACVLVGVKNGRGGLFNIYYKDHVLSNPANGYEGCSFMSTPTAKTWPVYEQQNANDGLCISQITIRDGYTESNTINNKYEFEGGQRFFKGGLSWYYSGGHMPINNDPRERAGTGVFEAKIYSNYSLTGTMDINGSNHGYTYATVKTFNGDGVLQGSTRTHFTNLMLHDDSTRSNLEMDPDSLANAYPVKNFFRYRMGKVLDVTEYDASGGQRQQVSYAYQDGYRNTPSYRDDNSSFLNTVKIQDVYFKPKYYSFHNYPFLVKQKSTTTMTNNGNFSMTYRSSYFDNTYLPKDMAWEDEEHTAFIKQFNYEWMGFGSVMALKSTDLYRKKLNDTVYLVDRTEEGYSPLPGNGYVHSSSSKFYNKDLYLGWGNTSLVNKAQEYISRDNRNNVTEIKTDDKDQYDVCLWDNRLGKKVADIHNARLDEVAYTSFEGQFDTVKSGINDNDKGNWLFSPASVMYLPANGTQKAMTGSYYYALSSASAISSLNPAKNDLSYIISFWASDAPVVSNGVNNLPLTLQQQVGPWKFYTARFSGNGRNISLSAGTTIRLDELRLYPFDATMSTTTYEPLLGPNSQCDDRGNITYYGYDVMGRPNEIRDINRNIISYTKQVIAGPDTY